MRKKGKKVENYNLFQKESTHYLNNLISGIEDTVVEVEARQQKVYAKEKPSRLQEMSRKYDIDNLIGKVKKEKEIQLVSSLNFSLTREMSDGLVPFESPDLVLKEDDLNEEQKKALEEQKKALEIIRDKELEKRIEKDNEIKTNEYKRESLVPVIETTRRDLKEKYFKDGRDNPKLKIYKPIAVFICGVMIVFSLLQIFRMTLEIIPFLDQYFSESPYDYFFIFIFILYALIIMLILFPKVFETLINQSKKIFKEVKDVFGFSSDDKDSNGNKSSGPTTLGIFSRVIRIALISILGILFLYLSIAGENASADSKEYFNTESLLVSFVFILVYYGISEGNLPDFLKSPRKIMDPSVKNVGAILGAEFKEFVEEVDNRITLLLDSSKQSVMNLQNEITGRSGDFLKDIEKVKNTLTENFVSLSSLIPDHLKDKPSEEKRTKFTIFLNRVFLLTLFLGLILFALFKPTLEEIFHISFPNFLYGIILIVIGILVLKLILDELVLRQNKDNSIKDLKYTFLLKICDYLLFYNHQLEVLMKDIENSNEKSANILEKLHQKIEKIEKDYKYFLNDYNIITAFPPHIFAICLLVLIGSGFTLVFYFENLIQGFLILIEICVAGYFVRKKSDTEKGKDSLIKEEDTTTNVPP